MFVVAGKGGDTAAGAGPGPPPACCVAPPACWAGSSHPKKSPVGSALCGCSCPSSQIFPLPIYITGFTALELRDLPRYEMGRIRGCGHRRTRRRQLHIGLLPAIGDCCPVREPHVPRSRAAATVAVTAEPSGICTTRPGSPPALAGAAFAGADCCAAGCGPASCRRSATSYRRCRLCRCRRHPLCRHRRRTCRARHPQSRRACCDHESRRHQIRRQNHGPPIRQPGRQTAQRVHRQ